jgi:hypothetical protein
MAIAKKKVALKKPVKKPVKKATKKVSEKVEIRKPFSGSKDISYENASSGVDNLTGMRPRVWVSYSVTHQIKQFEPIKIEAGISDDVKEGETFEDAFRRITEPLMVKIKLEDSKLKVGNRTGTPRKQKKVIKK